MVVRPRRGVKVRTPEPSALDGSVGSCESLARAHVGASKGMTTTNDASIGELFAEKYRIVRVIGRGGTATTYEVVCPDGTPAVLKRLSLNRAHDWKAIELFEREARVLAHLSHPAIPRYIDHFQLEAAEGTAFCLVQELAPGKSLAAWLREGWRPGEADVKKLAAVVLGILEYLQGLSPPVIHRDIKPENILRSNDGQVFLVDFGAVRDTHRTFLGEGSTVVGTYGYMAPEQFRGNAITATDLFGLGATLLTCLTHKSPNDLPQRGLKTDFRSVARFSPAFEAWLDKMLEPEAERRFASATQAAIALRDVGRRPFLKRRAVTIVAGIALGLGVASLATYIGLGMYGNVAAVRARARMSSATWRMMGSLAGHFGAVDSVAFDVTGNYLLSGSRDGTARVWSTADWRSSPLVGKGGERGVVAFTPNGRDAFTAFDDAVNHWSARDWSLTRKLSGHSGAVSALHVSGDGNLLASSGLDGTVRLWQVATGTEVRTIRTGSKRVFAVQLSTDGQTLVSAGEPAGIEVWDANKGTLRRALTGHLGSVNALRLSKDGNTLISASDDRTVKVWFLPRGQVMRTLEGHTNEVWALALASDGATLASGGRDGRIRIWDLFRGTLLDELIVEGVPIQSLSFNTRGDWLAAGCGDAVVRTWRSSLETKNLWRAPMVERPVARIASPQPTKGAPEEDRLTFAARALFDAPDGGKPGEALPLLRKAIARNDKYIPALLLLGRAEYRAGQGARGEYDPASLSRAHDAFDRALALQPRSAEAVALKGFAYLFQGNTQDAKRSLEQALAIDATSARAHLLGCEAAARRNDVDEELAHAKAVVEQTSDPDLLASAYGYLAATYRAGGHWDLADASFRSLVNLSPGSAQVRISYARYLMARGDHDRALDMAKGAIAAHDIPAAHGALADAYAAKAETLIVAPGRRSEAPPLLVLAQAESSTADVHYALGLLHQTIARSDGKPDEIPKARAEFESALRIEPTHARAKAALSGM